MLPFLVGAQSEAWLESVGVVSGDNLGTIIEKGRLYYEQHPELTSTPTFNGFQYDADYKKFRRLEYFWSGRMDEFGNPMPITGDELAENVRLARGTVNQRSMWESINQTQPGTSQGYDGMGRTTSVAFHPTDPATFLVSAAIGGVWLTTDGGNTYTAIGDNLPNLAVSDVVFDPNDPQTIYAATGDAVWYGLPSTGIYKTTDLGQTWALTDLTFNLSVDARIPKLLINPENGTTLFAATNKGLYRTLNGGTSWESIRSGAHWDVVYKPGDTTTLYTLGIVGGDLEIFASTDNGASFVQLTTLGLNNSTSTPSYLGVTNADSDFLYYMNGASNKLYLSTDNGVSFSLQLSGLEGRDAFGVSHANENNVYIGALDNYASNDRGLSFSKKTNWYDNGVDAPVHADCHRIVAHPLEPNKLFVCNDGGLYVYDELLDTWTEFSAGLIITQYYSVAVSQTDPFLVMGGTQDNGTRIRTNSPSWRAGNGGDGMECAISTLNANILYCTYVNGELYRSFDGWVNDTYNNITPQVNGNNAVGDWVAPFVLDPSDNSTILAGYNDVFYSTDQGNNWDQISTNIFSGNDVQEVGISPADHNYLYAILGNKVKYTKDGGNSWTQRIVSGSVNLQSITFHPSDTNQYWVSGGSYTNSPRVFYTSDHGLTFTNISAGLPSVPVNKIIYQNGGNGLLYAGTDFGVYYYDGTQWNAMNDQLPLTQVTDIELQYSSSKIRIATHGRGIWQTDFMDPLPVSVDEQSLETRLKVYPNPSKGIFHVQQFDATSMNWEVYDMYGRKIWSQNNAQNPDIDLRASSKGIYILRFNDGINYGMTRIVID